MRRRQQVITLPHPYQEIRLINHSIAGIPIVRVDDRQLARSVGVFAFPSIVIFRSFGEEAIIYAGDLKNEAAVLEWLVVQKDPANEAIDDRAGEALARIIERMEFVAVYVCKQPEHESRRSDRLAPKVGHLTSLVPVP
jgi:hypothetical protein